MDVQNENKVDAISEEFNNYWLLYGVNFIEKLYEFAEKNGGLASYVDFKQPSKELNIQRLILDFWTHTFENKPCQPQSVESLFDDFFDDSHATQNQFYSKLSWSLYDLIRRKYSDVYNNTTENCADNINSENDEFLNDYLLLDFIENPSTTFIKKRNKKKKKKINKVLRSRSIGVVDLIPLVSVETIGTKNEEYYKSKNLFKYWLQRHRYFSKFDLGIEIDDESFFSVTPEEIAIHQAKRCASSVILDPFCGCGGNIIQFSFTCSFVIACDIDRSKLKMAAHNSKVYEVRNNIDFINADALQISSFLRYDTVFLSPPWGGPLYSHRNFFSVSKHMSPNCYQLFNSLNQTCRSVALFLPRNSSIKELKKLSKKFFDGRLEVEKNFLNRKLKALTVYFGELGNF